jgi:hypothetical protein
MSHEDVWGSEFIDSVFFTSALVGDEWLASRPYRFTTREKNPGTHLKEAEWALEPIWTT